LITARNDPELRNGGTHQAAAGGTHGAAIDIPDLIHAGQEWSAPARTAKAVPAHIERRFFPETRITGFRLAA